MSGKTPPPTPKKKRGVACTTPIPTILATVGLENRDDSKTRGPHRDKKNGRHNINRSAHANTFTTPTSTIELEAYIPDTFSIHYCGCDHSSYVYALRDSSLSILTSRWYRLYLHSRAFYVLVSSVRQCIIASR